MHHSMPGDTTTGQTPITIVAVGVGVWNESQLMQMGQNRRVANQCVTGMADDWATKVYTEHVPTAVTRGH